MAINFTNGFNITSKEAIDSRIILTKVQMQNMTAGQMLKMPDVYLCLCPDDHKFYVFDKNNENLSPVGGLGKFRPIEDYLDYSTPEAKTQFEEILNNSETMISLETSVGQPASEEAPATGLYKLIDEINIDGGLVD